METNNFYNRRIHKRSGIGLKLLDINGKTKVYHDSEKLENDIKMMLLTPRGSLLGNPDYGSDIRKYIFEPNSVMSLELLSTEIYDILRSFDGVEVIEVRSVSDGDTIWIHYDMTYDTQEYSNTIMMASEEVWSNE